MCPGNLSEEAMTSIHDATTQTNLEGPQVSSPKGPLVSFPEYTKATDIELKRLVDTLLDEITPIRDSTFFDAASQKAGEITKREETSLILLGSSVIAKCHSFNETPNERFMSARCRLEDPLPWYSGERYHPYNAALYPKRKRARSWPSGFKATSETTSRPRALSHTSTAPTSYTE
ncbi:hypothetical protein AA313_de0206976 [Arthrobotrys entomopaga]|nr:hypothetical protein AA313_de0206976 [Arthrobotrys entomopaga]